MVSTISRPFLWSQIGSLTHGCYQLCYQSGYNSAVFAGGNSTADWPPLMRSNPAGAAGKFTSWEMASCRPGDLHPGTRSTAKPARKQKLDVTVPVTPAPKRAANGCNRFPASGRWLDRDAIAREIGLDFTNNAHRIFSPRGAAVTSADEASHVYVPGRRNRTWKLSGRTPKLTGVAPSGSSPSQSPHPPPPPPSKPLQGERSIC
jgi:hypothetical protein